MNNIFNLIDFLCFVVGGVLVGYTQGWVTGLGFALMVLSVKDRGD